MVLNFIKLGLIALEIGESKKKHMIQKVKFVKICLEENNRLMFLSTRIIFHLSELFDKDFPIVAIF